MPKVSVIVPVFNTEKYISECIDSILAQTFTDWELILVDDGSKDNSGKICDEYATKDSRVRVLHQPNGGVTSARSNGVKNAKGEWITFVDADDTLPEDALKMMIEKVDDNTDIVVGRYDDRTYPVDMSLDEYRRCCISGRRVHSGPVARFFRSCLFNDSTFDIPREIIRGEDLIMNVRLAFATETPPVLLDKKVYNYRQNENSVMHTSKHTIAYSSMFFQQLVRAIPNPEYYQNEIISRKISSIQGIITDSPSDSSWRNSIFWQTLRKEMRVANYKMSLQDCIILKTKGKISFWMAIRLFNLLNRFY